MAYSLPVFNIIVAAWRSPRTPAANPIPDYANMFAQLYVNSKPQTDVTPGFPLDWVPPIVMRLDPATNPSDVLIWIYEAPILSGRFYKVRFKEVVASRFPNEYEMHIVSQCSATGAPIVRDVQ